jgi:hypothetical protein
MRVLNNRPQRLTTWAVDTMTRLAQDQDREGVCRVYGWAVRRMTGSDRHLERLHRATAFVMFIMQAN